MPTLGNTSTSSTDIEIVENIVTCPFQMPDTNGIGVSITAYLEENISLGTMGVKGMVYTSGSEGSHELNGDATAEETITGTFGTDWVTCTFQAQKEPSFTANEWYFISIWGDNGVEIGTVNAQYATTEGNGVLFKSETWGSPPDPLASLTTQDADGNQSIYCTYTAVAPATEKALGTGEYSAAATEEE